MSGIPVIVSPRGAPVVATTRGQPEIWPDGLDMGAD